MQPYKSKSRKKSGISAYQSGSNYIIVQFNHAGIYKYSYKSAGKLMVEKMKVLAVQQKGLSTFIAREHPPYESSTAN